MGLGRVGGLLLIGGWVLLLFTALIFVGGGPIRIGDGAIGGLVLTAALVLAGFGTAILSIAGPPPLQGRAVRVGLAMVAIGSLSSVSFSILAGDVANSPFVVAFLLGGFTTFIGLLVVVVTLVRSPRPSRLVGSSFLVGFLLVVLGGTLGAGTNLEPDPVPTIGRILVALGGIGFVLGGAGIGALAVTGERYTPG